MNAEGTTSLPPNVTSMWNNDTSIDPNNTQSLPSSLWCRDVDPDATLPMSQATLLNKGITEHPSYVGVMTKEKAEEKVRAHDSNRYITRYDIAQDCYVLTIQKKGSRPAHREIVTKNKQYQIKGKTRVFRVFTDLIICYLMGYRSVNIMVPAGVRHLR